VTPLPRVVLVDDHGLFRAGVRAELDGLVDVVGDAGTVGEAVECIVRTEPEVVLLDVQMPDGGGAEVIRGVGLRGSRTVQKRAKASSRPAMELRTAARVHLSSALATAICANASVAGSLGTSPSASAQIPDSA